MTYLVREQPGHTPCCQGGAHTGTELCGGLGVACCAPRQLLHMDHLRAVACPFPSYKKALLKTLCTAV